MLLRDNNIVKMEVSKICLCKVCLDLLVTVSDNIYVLEQLLLCGSCKGFFARINGCTVFSSILNL